MTRPTNEALDGILGKPFFVLDHGELRVIDYMGDDAAIVQAARVSYGAGTKHVSEDEGLIRYLMRNHHSTPFEMCEIKLHVKLPVFVARQWIRHRTASVNEISARYSILDGDFYIPEAKNIAHQSTVNNQGRGVQVSEEQAKEIRKYLMKSSQDRYYNYLDMTDPKGDYDLARELARMDLPANIYTQWYWKTNLHNLFNFLRLRADPHAQYEIRVYADKMLELVREWVPMATKAFEDYRLNAVTFSAGEMEHIRLHMANATGLTCDFDTLDEAVEAYEDDFRNPHRGSLSKREKTELVGKLK